jgi:hypothetical protein
VRYLALIENPVMIPVEAQRRRADQPLKRFPVGSGSNGLVRIEFIIS